MVHRTDPDAPVRRRRLGAAIRRHRGDLSQFDLAKALGVSQAGVSLWESGGVDFSYEQVRDIEQELGLPSGTLGWLAGYTDPATSMCPLFMIVERFDDVIEVLMAASVLGLHVAAANRFEPSTDNPRETWVVVVGGDEHVVDDPL